MSLPFQAVRAEDVPRLPYIAAVCDEALRLWPPGDSSYRKQTQDLRLPDGRV
jgi:cytochrome P450